MKKNNVLTIEILEAWLGDFIREGMLDQLYDWSQLLTFVKEQSEPESIVSPPPGFLEQYIDWLEQSLEQSKKVTVIDPKHRKAIADIDNEQKEVLSWLHCLVKENINC